jgi:transcription-repair coupling factor (superfamily II helicase)
LNKIYDEKNIIIVTTIEAAQQKLISKKELYKNTLNFKIGQRCNLDEIKQKLVDLGYTRCDLIEGRGQFSVRGGIVDIYNLYM